MRSGPCCFIRIFLPISERGPAAIYGKDDAVDKGGSVVSQETDHPGHIVGVPGFSKGYDFAAGCIAIHVGTPHGRRDLGGKAAGCDRITADIVLLAKTTTLAPSWAGTSTIRFPIPELAPVTMITFPAVLIGSPFRILWLGMSFMPFFLAKEIFLVQFERTIHKYPKV